MSPPTVPIRSRRSLAATASPASSWRRSNGLPHGPLPASTPIVITWDEDGPLDRLAGSPISCCVVDAHNPGGGHIATVVVTNHGPRGVTDATHYDHYSLLGTIEDALGVDGHLLHAGDDAVVPMAPLFGPLTR